MAPHISQHVSHFLEQPSPDVMPKSTRMAQLLVSATDTPMAMPTSGPTEKTLRKAMMAQMPVPAATNAADTAMDSTHRWLASAMKADTTSP